MQHCASSRFLKAINNLGGIRSFGGVAHAGDPRLRGGENSTFDLGNRGVEANIHLVFVKGKNRLVLSAKVYGYSKNGSRVSRLLRLLEEGSFRSAVLGVSSAHELLWPIPENSYGPVAFHGILGGKRG